MAETETIAPCQFCGAAGSRTGVRRDGQLLACVSWECGSMQIDGEAVTQCINKCRIRQLEAEVTRVLSGDFSPEEFQNLCHALGRSDHPCQVADFVAGCEAYQRKLFGRSPAQEDREVKLAVTNTLQQVRNALPSAIAPYPADLVLAVKHLVASWEAQRESLKILIQQRDEAVRRADRLGPY